MIISSFRSDIEVSSVTNTVLMSFSTINMFLAVLKHLVLLVQGGSAKMSLKMAKNY